ncbi:hypothetical protein N7G274_001388 [Stereocaulon virgatum]|uniref:Pentatricopeptide repeat domain-containing protein n=1 Tax=Stereocaulon virgatum TaxID=373712 RepID=A0ABR4ANP6_9LECA
MRPALQRLLGSPSALSLLRNALNSNSFGVCQHHYSKTCFGDDLGEAEPVERHEQKHSVTWKQTVKGSVEFKSRTGLQTVNRNTLAQVRHGEDDGPVAPQGHAIEYWAGSPSRVPNAPKKTLEDNEQGLIARKEWRSRLSTFQQYLDESNLDAPISDRPLLIKNELYATDWLLWLELIRFRRRHIGIPGTQIVFEEIFRRDKHLPTKGSVGKELWDLLFQAGHQDQKFMEIVVTYAVGLKRANGNTSPRTYGSVVGHALKTDPKSALGWHTLLKEEIVPSIEDYKKLFRLCVSWGSVANLRDLYDDLPLLGMYTTTIPELCRLQMYDEAIKWHHLFCEHHDFPLEFDDLKPLLAYLAQTGDSRQMEQVISGLDEALPTITEVATKYIRKNEVISREILNRQLGEVHGVASKQLSDGFCARLFATRTFAVKTVITGLQMMAVESIGPISLREIALRDDCFPEAILRHLGHLKDAGISLDNSIFSVLLQDLARTSDQRLLRALVECDGHPDTFEDLDLQEKLLAQYYEVGDQLQVERTLAILTTRAPSQKDRARWWWNLVLRSHVTLKQPDAVRSIMDTMQRANIPVSVRSSRHLRVIWLSKRQVARRAARTNELSIIICATQSTMRSGGYVPIISWREIMRRLGMAGRLVEFENLALWLVDYYSSPIGQQSLPPRPLLQSSRDSRLLESGFRQPGSEVKNLARNHNPRKSLNILFTTDAQQAIVAWGFQQEVKVPLRSKHAVKRLQLGSTESYPRVRPLWTWGLVLLRRLQERGVPIQQATVSRICKHRLNALFGHGQSNRAMNRQAKWINDLRVSTTGRSTKESYVREMEDIWGQDLFRHQIQWDRGFEHRRKVHSRYWSERAKHGRWQSVESY